MPTMANVNKVMLVGRMATPPGDPRTFASGGKVISFRFAVNNRKKNQQTGEWEDDPCFLDVKAFNRENGRKLADLVEQYLHKGDLAYIEGHLVQEKWQDKTTNENRSKIVVYMDDVQFLQPKADGAPRGTAQAPRQSAPARQPAAAYGDEHDDNQDQMEPQGGPPEGDIPF
jgi:single-strand DNA-binding protein